MRDSSRRYPPSSQLLGRVYRRVISDDDTLSSGASSSTKRSSYTSGTSGLRVPDNLIQRALWYNAEPAIYIVTSSCIRYRVYRKSRKKSTTRVPNGSCVTVIMLILRVREYRDNRSLLTIDTALVNSPNETRSLRQNFFFCFVLFFFRFRRFISNERLQLRLTPVTLVALVKSTVTIAS